MSKRVKNNIPPVLSFAPRLARGGMSIRLIPERERVKVIWSGAGNPSGLSFVQENGGDIEGTNVSYLTWDAISALVKWKELDSGGCVGEESP